MNPMARISERLRVSRKIGAACEAKGVEFLDAPVSGGEAGAISGQLAIMAGGKKDVFALAEPIPGPTIS